jgi:hypothetical protein
VFSLQGTNTDALKDLDALLHAIDAPRPSLAGGGEQARYEALYYSEVNRLLTAPLAETLGRHGFTANEIDAYHTMLERGFDALTDDNIQSIEATLTGRISCPAQGCPTLARGLGLASLRAQNSCPFSTDLRPDLTTYRCAYQVRVPQCQI